MEFVIWRPMILLVLLLTIVLTPETSNAQIVTSTFDDGADGWTATEPDEVAWAPAGGNPDGYLRFEELSANNTYIIAPPAFLGDWSILDGSGSLEYDHKIFDPADGWQFIPYRIWISGSGGSAEWLGPTPDGATEWVTLSAPIDEAAWNVQSGTWSDLLADVEVLWIRIEQVNNFSGGGDSDGIDNVRLISMVGPTLVMREPWVEDDDVHTGPTGVDSLRLLWSEAVLFDNEDVSITNEDAEPVPFSVSGSNSQFMIIAFDAVLLNDEYIITIYDSVVSAETGAAIDGDNDGLAGGDAVLIMEHRDRLDHDNDNDIDLSDLAELLSRYGTTYG